MWLAALACWAFEVVTKIYGNRYLVKNGRFSQGQLRRSFVPTKRFSRIGGALSGTEERRAHLVGFAHLAGISDSGRSGGSHMPHLFDNRARSSKVGHAPDNLARSTAHRVPSNPVRSSRDTLAFAIRNVFFHRLYLTATRSAQSDLRDERIRQCFAGTLGLAPQLPRVERDILDLQHAIMAQKSCYRDGDAKKCSV